MALTPDENEKIERLGHTLHDIDAGIESMNSTLTGALKMARIGREALEQVGCQDVDCIPAEQCVVCRALADIVAVAREFSP